MKIEVSVGEIVDKVSILEIKTTKISDKQKLSNVEREYKLIKEAMESLGINIDSIDYQELKKINLDIWETEDAVRNLELEKDFTNEFIQFARNVYFFNDKRAAVKRRINLKHNSMIVEEKEYTDYGRTE